MPVNEPNYTKKRTVPYRDAKGTTRMVKVLSAGGSSGGKIRHAHRTTKVQDNVATSTTAKGTDKLFHRRGPA